LVSLPRSIVATGVCRIVFAVREPEILAMRDGRGRPDSGFAAVASPGMGPE
jgi:hypothetical protein